MDIRGCICTFGGEFCPCLYYHHQQQQQQTKEKKVRDLCVIIVVDSNQLWTDAAYNPFTVPSLHIYTQSQDPVPCTPYTGQCQPLRLLSFFCHYSIL